MKLPLQILAWVAVGLGFLSVFASMYDGDQFGLVGGALYLTLGILALAYVAEKEKK